jgi:hypothetical protein
MRRAILLVMLLILLADCGRYSLVEPGRQTIAGFYTVETRIAWSRISDSEAELWTVNGPALDAIRFFGALHEGDIMFAAVGDEVLPRYRADMKANDVMKFVVDSIAREGANEVEAAALEPFAFGGRDGFRFEMTLLSPDGLEMQGVVVGFQTESELNLILYTGTRMYYFPKYWPVVEGIIASIEIG